MVAPWEMEWAAATPTNQPRGLRNNNPLNLEATVNWTGMQGNDGRFAVFPDMESGVAAADRNLQTYATKHGLNTVEGVINRWAPPVENDSRAYAQTVAQKLGVDPTAPLDMSDPQVRRALLDAMADVENGQNVDLGAAMPQQAEAPPWEQDWAVQSTPPPPKSREIAASANRGVTVEALGPDPTIAQDAASGAWQPFRNLLDRVASGIERQTELARQGPGNPLEELKRFGGDLAGVAGLAGDTLGLLSAPVQAAVRPAARAVNRLPLQAYAPQSFREAVSGQAPRAMGDVEEQGMLEGLINTALSAARPASPVPRVKPPKPMSLDELQKAKTAAYEAVDNLGVAYSPKAGATLADQIGYDLATKRINPKVTPKAHAVMEDVIDQLRSGNPLRLDQLDDMRQQVWRATGKGDDAEQFFGSRIRELIDNFVDNAGPGDVLNGNAPQAAEALRAARDMNTRWRKVQEVSNRVESADLRASSTYAGGNQANAARQNLRPLIDPKSNQRIRNLTPAETAALNKVVRGTGGANAARVTGKLLDPRGLMGQVALGPLGIPSVGLTPAIGAVASEASNALTMKAVNDLIKLMAQGGTKASSAPPVNSILALAGRPGPPLLSGPGAVGASVTAAPLTRIPAESKTKAGSRPAPRKPPKKRKAP